MLHTDAIIAITVDLVNTLDILWYVMCTWCNISLMGFWERGDHGKNGNNVPFLFFKIPNCCSSLIKTWFCDAFRVHNGSHPAISGVSQVSLCTISEINVCCVSGVTNALACPLISQSRMEYFYSSKWTVVLFLCILPLYVWISLCLQFLKLQKLC